MSPTPPFSSSRRTRGSALAVILPLLVIITVLVVATLTLVIFDNRQASSTLQKWQAENLARIAVNKVADKLSQIPLDKHWAAAPGRIRYWTGSTWDSINLYSEGNPADQVNLNAALANGSHAILNANAEYPAAPEMNVSWVYVRQDGSQTDQPTYDASNPIIGRFAYWTDIENGRVNLNTAGFGMTTFDPALKSWSIFSQPVPQRYPPSLASEYQVKLWDQNPWMSDRVTAGGSGLVFSSLARSAAQALTPQNLVAHPSSVDLSFLDSVTEQQSFNTFRYAGSYFLRADAKNSVLKADGTSWTAANPDLSVRMFHSPEDWKWIVPEATYEKNKGYLTTLGRTPEITPWGSPKLNLSLIRNDSNFLNVMSEHFQRSTQSTNNGPLLGSTSSPAYYLQDTRVTNVPAVYAYVNAGDPCDRGNMRDLGSAYDSQGNAATLGSLMDTVKKILDVPVPEYSTTLAAKYNAQGSAGETEQVATELLTYVDGSLNALSPGWQAFMISREPAVPFDSSGPTDSWKFPIKLFSGRWNPAAKGSSSRRLGTSGPFLVNELLLTADVTTFAEQKATVYALAGGLPSVNPPEAVLTNTTNGDAILFLTRAPNPGDVFIQINMDAELAAPANYGFAQEIRAVSFYGFITDLLCTYSSNDPSTPGGTLRFNNNQVKSVMNASGQSLFPYPKQGALFLAGDASMHPRPATGTNYALMTRWSNCRILLGPFAPGTQVTFNLKPKFVFASEPNTGSWGPSAQTRLWSMVPGIFTDTTSPSDFTASLDPADYLDYAFSIDTDAGIGTGDVVSFEADDPRVAKRAKDWKAAGSGTPGFTNSVYTGGGGGDSDLAKPSTLLQTVRSRVRGAALTPPVLVAGNLVLSWGGSQDKVEFQNASRILGLPGVGYLSSVPTAVDSGLPWKTMKFYSNSDNPPDWLLWNLFYVPFDRSIANQTDGKVNLNATLLPFGIQRKKPLEALLGNRVSNPATVASNIAGRVASGPLVGPSDMYVYSGQVCQITGVADAGANEYEKERLPRDIADLVTTQCSDFRVFAVAQSVRQSADGKIIPLATTRVEATVSRTVDMGPTDYPFGRLYSPNQTGTVGNVFNVYRRGAYAAQGTAAPKVNVYGLAERSPLGTDMTPNTADDWIIPQKITINSYRTIQ